MASPKHKAKHVIVQNEGVFFPELQRRYVEGSFEIKRLGVGTAGVVYQVSPTHVIKVMQSERYLKHLKWYKETLSNLQTLFEKRKHMFTYHHFYMHSDFETSDAKHDDGTPKFIYEKMHYMPMDLETYSKTADWNLQDFLTVMCQVMHGIRLFHSLQYILTDLKVQNILYNPVTKQLKLIDFFESYNLVLKPTHNMYTYQNLNNPKGSKKEDVWRLGLLMLAFIFPKVNKLLHQDGKHPLPYFLHALRQAVTKTRPPKPYNYNVMIHPYLQMMCQTMVDHSEPKDQLTWKGIFHITEKMLAENPEQRPAIRHVLASNVFCDHCLVPRVNYGVHSDNASATHPQADITSPSLTAKQATEQTSSNEAFIASVDSRKLNGKQEEPAEPHDQHTDGSSTEASVLSERSNHNHESASDSASNSASKHGDEKEAPEPASSSVEDEKPRPVRTHTRRKSTRRKPTRKRRKKYQRMSTVSKPNAVRSKKIPKR